MNENYEEKVLNMAKDIKLLNQRIYFSILSDIEEYGTYATLRGFVNGIEGFRVAVSFIKEPYKILLFHPSRFGEFFSMNQMIL